mgnify:CR=1 FL=1
MSNDPKNISYVTPASVEKTYSSTPVPTPPVSTAAVAPPDAVKASASVNSVPVPLIVEGPT